MLCRDPRQFLWYSYSNIGCSGGYTDLPPAIFDWLINIRPGYLFLRTRDHCITELYMPCQFVRQFGYDQLLIGNPNPLLSYTGNLPKRLVVGITPLPTIHIPLLYYLVQSPSFASLLGFVSGMQGQIRLWVLTRTLLFPLTSLLTIQLWKALRRDFGCRG